MSYLKEIAIVHNEKHKYINQGRIDEYNRIIGFLKYYQFAVVDNNGKYYSIEELEEELKKITD